MDRGEGLQIGGEVFVQFLGDVTLDAKWRLVRMESFVVADEEK